MNFREYLLQEKTETNIKVLLYLSDNIDSLNEEFVLEGKLDGLKKFGISAHKSKSLLSYIKSFTGSVGKVFLYMIKGDLDKAKEIVKTLKKEDVLDFLLKLDAGTLHLISGPLHTIDAWTGWHIAANVQKKMDQGKNIINVIKDALEKVKSGVDQIFSTDKSKQNILKSYIDNIDKEFTALVQVK